MKNYFCLINTFLIAFILSVEVHAMNSKVILDSINSNPDYYKTKFTSEQLNGISGDPDNVGMKNDLYNLFEQAWDERNNSSKSLPGFKPQELHKVYYNIIQSHYVNGYISKNTFDNWNNQYKTLFNDVIPPQIIEESEKKTFYLNQYKSVFNPYFAHLESSSMSCASEGEAVGNQKCCINHAKIPSLNTEARSCKSMGNSCQSAGDCCSNICVTDGEGGPGICEPEVQCTRVREVSEQCDSINSICRIGLCTNQDISKVVSNPNCKKREMACSASNECCSGLCENNKCQESMMCENCSTGGKVLNANETCCPGYIKLKNKCVLPIPRYVPTVMSPIKKGILIVSHFLINAVMGNAIAMDTSNINAAQQRLLAQKAAKCQMITDSEDQELCLDQIQRDVERFQNDEYLELTEDQSQGLLAQRERCTNSYETATEDHTKCMAAVDVTEKSMKAANRAQGKSCANTNKLGSKEYKDCMVSAGLMDKRKSKEGYVDAYGIPGVTAKTYSDPKSCEFNSYNDSWRDATNKERNGELFLRGFEFVFSHKGTEDYWFDKNAENKSIFTRANYIAQKFRENRKIMLTKMQEIDKKMSCQCIAIFGPSKFNIAKQEYFKSQCDEEQAFLRQALGEDLKDINQKLDSGDSKIDGETSLANSGDSTKSTEAENAKVEEIDKAAIGISHERLLVEWLNLRSEAQMDRFNLNSELEKELQELSTFITDKDSFDVFKDRIDSKTFYRASSDSRYHGDTPNGTYLYQWGYTYRPGWFKIVNILAFGVVGIIINNQMNFKKGSGNSSKASVSHSTKAAWQYHDSDEIHAMPEIIDIKRVKKKCVKRILVCVKYMDGFERWFLGPKFDNYSPVVSNRCQTNGRASTCFKSGYRTNFSNELAYILDPTQPLFVDNGVISLNQMPGYSQTFPEMLKKARDSGISYLKSLKPRGYIKYGYRKGGTKFGNDDHIAMAISKGHFVPNGGTLVVEPAEIKDSTTSIAVLIKKAAIKYSMCKNLKLCGAQGLLDEEAVGFGYLFEEESEAKEFADYVYQIHWKWSHMTKDSYMGYPLAGMDQYFTMVAYNMKLVGSLAASRSIKYAQAFQKFNSDFENRVGEYQSLGQVGVGTKSRNIKYSSAFYDTFELLNFSGETNLESFDAAAARAQSSTQFSSAETQALNNGRSSALRRNNDIKKKKELDKALKTAGVAAKRAYAANKGFYDAINKPLNSLSSKRLGGGNLGSSGGSSKKFNAALSGINDKLNLLSNKKNSSKGGYTRNKGASFTMPSGFKFNSRGSTGTSTYGSGNNDDGNGSSTLYGKNGRHRDSKMSASQVNSLLEGLENSSKSFNPSDDDTLFKIVSKAYKRNYSRVLRRSVPKPKDIKPKVQAPKAFNKDIKNELKSLLE